MLATKETERTKASYVHFELNYTALAYFSSYRAASTKKRVTYFQSVLYNTQQQYKLLHKRKMNPCSGCKGYKIKFTNMSFFFQFPLYIILKVSSFLLSYVHVFKVKLMKKVSECSNTFSLFWEIITDRLTNRATNRRI